jgi:hypothetical protein
MRNVFLYSSKSATQADLFCKGVIAGLHYMPNPTGNNPMCVTVVTEKDQFSIEWFAVILQEGKWVSGDDGAMAEFLPIDNKT